MQRQAYLRMRFGSSVGSKRTLPSFAMDQRFIACSLVGGGESGAVTVARLRACRRAWLDATLLRLSEGAAVTPAIGDLRRDLLMVLLCVRHSCSILARAFHAGAQPVLAGPILKLGGSRA